MISAREKAIEYLSRFARSERQVRDYLARKEYPPEEIREAVAYLVERGYLDDATYAESLIRDRIRRGDGPLKIRQALFRRGIASETQDRLLREHYPVELQLETAATLLRKRLRRVADRRRALQSVASRGFPRYVMIQALKSISEENDA